MSWITAATRMWLTKSLHPFEFTGTFDKELSYENTEGLGLYVHIPFCSRLCSFCPYCKVLYQKELAGDYVEALLKEIELTGGGQGSRKEVTSLYFGGGTPALLADELGRIIDTIRKYFIICHGIGVELHPDNVNKELLQKLKNAGVTRISIGIQSFQKEYLELLGRTQAEYHTMFEALGEVPFETVSMDFIFALPGQTFEMVKQDIDLAFANGANHIALYPFIDFTFTKRSFTKLSEKEKRRLLDQITDYCREKAYVRDSIWTFAKPGAGAYSSMTRDNFLGFGCSATTLLEDQFKINTFSVEEYIKRIQNSSLATALTIKFKRRQRMVYYLFWNAYTTKVDPAAFRRFFGKSLESQYGLELLLARLFGCVKKEAGIYVMTAKGAYYYHYYENFYTLSYIDKMWNLMSQEAFPEKLLL